MHLQTNHLPGQCWPAVSNTYKPINLSSLPDDSHCIMQREWPSWCTSCLMDRQTNSLAGLCQLAVTKLNGLLQSESPAKLRSSKMHKPINLRLDVKRTVRKKSYQIRVYKPINLRLAVSSSRMYGQIPTTYKQTVWLAAVSLLNGHASMDGLGQLEVRDPTGLMQSKLPVSCSLLEHASILNGQTNNLDGLGQLAVRKPNGLIQSKTLVNCFLSVHTSLLYGQTNSLDSWCQLAVGKPIGLLQSELPAKTKTKTKPKIWCTSRRAPVISRVFVHTFTL